MSDFSLNEMQEMQKALQEKYKHKCEPICAEIGQNKLLWMIGEIGEVIDIVKKHGGTKAVSFQRNKSLAGFVKYASRVKFAFGK